MYWESHGGHYADDGYYYGQKWQCMEYVKRFFHQACKHKMPDVWGHTESFFDHKTPHGNLNKARGLMQYRNGGPVYPKVGDLLVFTNGTHAHVPIISLVTTNEVQLIQQNILGKPRQRLPLKWTKTSFTIGPKSYQPAGWLRVPKKSLAANSDKK